MAIHLYHPNKAVKGFAASFWYSDRDDTVFATLIKQSGWDDQKQNGIFKGNLDDPNGRVNIKLDYVEIAAILDCIERGRPFNNFHDHDNTPKTITFTPWIDKTNNQQKGYSFTITVTSKEDSTHKNPFYIGLTFAEGRLIREFLIFTLNSHFQHLRSVNQLKSMARAAHPSPAPEASQEIQGQEIGPQQEEVQTSEDPLLNF
jgi:hypothetical protein